MKKAKKLILTTALAGTLVVAANGQVAHADTTNANGVTNVQPSADKEAIKQAYEHAKALLEETKATVKLLSGDLPAAQKEYAAAQADLAAKQNALEAAKQLTGDDAKAAVEKAQAELDEAQKNLKIAEQDLSVRQKNQESVDGLLAKHTAEYNEAKAKYDAVFGTQAGTNANGATGQSQGQQNGQSDQAGQEKQTGKATENAQTETSKTATQGEKQTFYLKDGKLVDQNGNPVAGHTVKGNQVFDANGKLVGTLKEQAKRNEAPKAQATAKKGELPQTGAKDQGWLAALGVMIISALGLAGVAKRKQQG